MNSAIASPSRSDFRSQVGREETTSHTLSTRARLLNIFEMTALTLGDQDPYDDDYWSTNVPNYGWIVLLPEQNELETHSATAVAEDEIMSKEPVQKTALDEALSIVWEFGNPTEGWNGPGTPVPSLDLIEDALVVLQNWPLSGIVPEPAVGFDGRIALELYDGKGFTLGGVEVTGDQTAIYSIVDRTEVIDNGEFDTTSQAGIIAALSKFEHHLS